jgi:hypothetical protein
MSIDAEGWDLAVLASNKTIGKSTGRNCCW